MDIDEAIDETQDWLDWFRDEDEPDFTVIDNGDSLTIIYNDD